MLLRAGAKYAYVPFQYLTPTDYARFGCSEAHCRKAVTLWIDGRLYTGAFAVNRFLWSFWFWRPAIVLLNVVFPLLLLEVLLYGVVARSRVWISAALGTTEYSLFD